jgi:hypothetical protein
VKIPPAPFGKGGGVRGLIKGEIFGVFFGLSVNPPGPLCKRERYFGLCKRGRYFGLCKRERYSGLWQRGRYSKAIEFKKKFSGPSSAFTMT